MSDRPKRKAMSLRVKLDAALYALGLTPSEVEFDHHPALGLRPVNTTGDDYDPPQLDPRYIVPRAKSVHSLKTTGRKGASDLSISGNGDQSRIAKAERLERKRIEDFNRKLLARNPEDVSNHPKLGSKRSNWPKGRKLQSRGFSKKTKTKGE